MVSYSGLKEQCLRESELNKPIELSKSFNLYRQISDFQRLRGKLIDSIDQSGSFKRFPCPCSSIILGPPSLCPFLHWLWPSEPGPCLSVSRKAG